MEKKICHSTDLLQPPTGAGAVFLHEELKGPGKRGLMRGGAGAQRSPKTFKIDESKALARARLLLPLMASAEVALKGQLGSGPEGCVDIENVAEHEPHIEIDLALVPVLSQETDESSSEESEEEEEEGGEGDQEARGKEEDDLKFPLKLPNRTRKRCVGIEELPSN